MPHSPGPWTSENLEPQTIGHDWVNGPDRRCIADCHQIVGNSPHGYCAMVDTDEIAANASLISAAPDMLTALTNLVLEWGDDLDDPFWIAARAAIAKATA